jgi:hypothetical protein
MGDRKIIGRLFNVVFRQKSEGPEGLNMLL